jgi:hypothetical protein
MAIEIIDFINKSSFFRKQLLNEYMLYIKSLKIDSGKLTDIRNQYGISERNNFNYFEPIKKYWKEDFNEIIITQLLDHNTIEIGSRKYLDIFIDLLHDINSNVKKIHYGLDVMVEKQIGNKEYGLIDILIHDGKKAIIIESKINGAPDQKNQLVRYYQYVKKILKEDVVSIVYIRPVDDEYKMPPIEDYSNKYIAETKIVKKLLVPISIVSNKDKKDFCHNFLDLCVKNTNETKDLAKIYIKQYSEILKILGGNKMILNIEKDIFKEIYTKEEDIIKINDLGELWEHRWLILYSLIQENLCKNLKFEADGDSYTYKKINNNIKLTFIYAPEEKKLGDEYFFGIAYEGLSQQKIKDFKKTLAEFDSNTILNVEVEILQDWLIVRRIYLDLNNPYVKAIDIVVELFKKLEKLLK